MSFSKEFINKNISSLSKIDNKILDKMVLILAECKNKNGRLFLIGVGGSAGHWEQSTRKQILRQF